VIDLSPASAPLATLLGPADGSALLRRGGLGSAAVDGAAERLAACARAIAGTDNGDRAAAAFSVPGRIEIFGKHTDYAGGRSLLCCTERGFVVAAARRADQLLNIIDVATGQRITLPVSAGLEAAPGDWSDYARTAARRLAANFPGASLGADVAFWSDIPPAAGLSSSSALVIALALSLIATGRIAEQPLFRAAVTSSEALAEYMAAMEAGTTWAGLVGAAGVGTESGSQDHTAILCGRADHIVRYSFAPVLHEGESPLPGDWVFAVGSSGVRAEKTAGALEHYNRLSRLAREAAGFWRDSRGGRIRHLGDVLRAGPDAAETLTTLIQRSAASDADALVARVRQFAEETNILVPGAFDAFRAGAAVRLGEFAARSHHLADQYLKNQIPATNGLVESARANGAFAASAFGAGFGGSVWALVRRDIARSFLDAWRGAAQRAFPERSTESIFFLTDAAPPAQRIA
jgi:galactokinase